MQTHIYQTNSINLNINVNKGFLVRTVNEMDRADGRDTCICTSVRKSD
jgi:hypothetical protein